MDPLAEQAPGWTPYRYGFNNPIKYTDPTGMFEDPVYGSDGAYRGNTKEGFTGSVIIYDGDKDFSEMAAMDLLYDGSFDVSTQKGDANTYDIVRNELSSEAKSKIWTHIVSQMEGTQIYDKKFSMSTIEGGVQYMDFSGSWGVPTSQAGKGKGNIYGSGNYSYETTVENIQSSVVVHEWYSHLQKGQGDLMKSHRLAYKNVVNYKPLWNNTTDAYKGFNMRQLERYTIQESNGRKTRVDPLYRNLYNKYSNKY